MAQNPPEGIHRLRMAIFGDFLHFFVPIALKGSYDGTFHVSHAPRPGELGLLFYHISYKAQYLRESKSTTFFTLFGFDLLKCWKCLPMKSLIVSVRMI